MRRFMMKFLKRIIPLSCLCIAFGVFCADSADGMEKPTSSTITFQCDNKNVTVTLDSEHDKRLRDEGLDSAEDTVERRKAIGTILVSQLETYRDNDPDFVRRLDAGQEVIGVEVASLE